MQKDNESKQRKNIDNIPKLPRSGAIEADGSLCMTCRECEVSCSLYHDGECSPSLSRIHIQYDDFIPGNPAIFVCKQCDWPACYYACTSRWDDPAIRIDEITGARYIDSEKCRGCGSCLRACPLEPEHSIIGFSKAGNKRVYFKCDLCHDRPEGPVCVDVCPSEALKFVSAEERRV